MNSGIRQHALGAALILMVSACASGGAGPSAPVSAGSGGVVKVWLTTGDQARLLAREPDLDFSATDVAAGAALVIDIDPATRYQEMVGFGAAMTDSAAFNLRHRMNTQQRAELMQDFFGRASGIGLGFMRITIGASDFSRTHYSLDDMAAGKTDPQLNNFSIAPNRADLLPAVKEALAVNPGLRIVASPWSAPGWMKTTDSLIGGTLKPEAYAPFAHYLKRYLDAYKAEGVPVYALTMQNEPAFTPDNYPGMRLDPNQRAAIVGGYLGPLLAQHYPDVRLLDWDHNWDAPASPAAVLSDPAAARYISGVAWHCYAGSADAQTEVHNLFPSKDAYFTECTGGEWATNWSDNLQWSVTTLIIGTTRNWAKGVLLWNLALDEHHGPHLGGCNDCRGVVTIDSTTGAVTRNPEYYALAHASKFVRPGAQRIASNSVTGGLQTVAFRNADDGSIALLVANSSGQAQTFAVRIDGRTFRYTAPARAVATLVWGGTQG